MTVSREEAATVVAYLNRAGLVQALEGQAGVWWDVLNAAGVRAVDVQAACRLLVAERMGGAVAVLGEDAPTHDRRIFIGPGDVIARVRKLRRERVGNRTPPAPPDDVADDVAATIRWQRAYLAALGDGADEGQADGAACRLLGVVRPPVVLVEGDVVGAIERGAR